MKKTYIRATIPILLAGAMAAGCGREKEKGAAADAGDPGTRPPTGVVAVADGKVVPPKMEKLTREERIENRDRRNEALLEQTLNLRQKTTDELLDLARKMYEAETAARAASPELQAAYDAVNRARADYDAKLAAVPEMAALTARQNELQSVYQKMSERKKLLEQEKTTP